MYRTDLPSILTPDETAALIRRSVDTLKYWRQAGRGPAWYRLGRRVVYDLDAVTAWLDEQRRASGVAAS